MDLTLNLSSLTQKPLDYVITKIVEYLKDDAKKKGKEFFEFLHDTCEKLSIDRSFHSSLNLVLSIAKKIDTVDDYIRECINFVLYFLPLSEYMKKLLEIILKTEAEGIKIILEILEEMGKLEEEEAKLINQNKEKIGSYNKLNKVIKAVRKHDKYNETWVADKVLKFSTLINNHIK